MRDSIERVVARAGLDEDALGRGGVQRLLAPQWGSLPFEPSDAARQKAIPPRTVARSPSCAY
jgi:hypothetical protein